MPGPAEIRSSHLTVCTLWEGDYHKGLASLVNSLVRAGFSGKVWAGYRGSLPQWASGGTASNGQYAFDVTPDVQIVFVALEGSQHFAHYKPSWCLRVLNELDPTAGGVYYFDPDIVVLAEWPFFEQWVQAGVAVCEDSHYPLNPSHPRSLQWQSFAQSAGFKLRRPADANLNSGLVGVSREQASFLEDWEQLLATVVREFKTEGKLKIGSRSYIFHIPDQDTFTIATWVTSQPVSLMGVDAMSFGCGEWLTLHATEGKKPWRRRIFMDWLSQGIAPDRALRRYWEFAAGPIWAESKDRIRSQTKLIPIVAGLSRFYRRG